MFKCRSLAASSAHRRCKFTFFFFSFFFFPAVIWTQTMDDLKPFSFPARSPCVRLHNLLPVGAALRRRRMNLTCSENN